LKKLSLATQNLWAKKSNDGDILWLSLPIHMADCALIAQKIWNKWLPDGVISTLEGETFDGCAERLFVFLAAAHDIGKATPVFQAKRIRHNSGNLDDVIEARLIANNLPLKDQSRFSQAHKTPHSLATQLLLERSGCDKRISVILGSHHGKPPEGTMLIDGSIEANTDNYYLGKEGKREWSAVQNELIYFALELAGLSSLDEIAKPNIAAQVLLSGLVIMTDWIASNEKLFPYTSFTDKLNYSNTEIRVNEAWKELNITSTWIPSNRWMSHRFFLQRFDYTPNPVQTEVVKLASGIIKPGIAVIEAPMGLGKTEAALALAEIFADKANRAGVFFALPTQATTDGIFPRILRWINRLEDDEVHSIKLAHGKAQFNDYNLSIKRFEGSKNICDEESGGVLVHEWFEGRKKSLLADFVVGTIDQLLLAALKHKHLMLRHLGLAGKVIIIDECHAYDAYMSVYLDMALRWLGAYNVPVIVLSATLPLQKRQMVIDSYQNVKLASKQQNSAIYDPLEINKRKSIQCQEWAISKDYPLITYTDGNSIKQVSVPIDNNSTTVQLDYLNEDAIGDTLDDLISGGGGCIGVIVNTVGRSQKLAKILCERFGDDSVQLLHSRFLAQDRIDQEKKLLNELGNPNNCSERPKKRIVIGTQVLEQSLDIDFDMLITDICPMDLLLQRIGRLHRHNRSRPQNFKSARCLIMGVEGDYFEGGTKAVYGEYLLMRTKATLPSKITLPKDIPILVQKVYDSDEINIQSQEYESAKNEWEKKIADKERRAEAFRICPPWKDDPFVSLFNWLHTEANVTEKQGEANVRDTDESIEVLLVQEINNKMYFLPWVENGRELFINETPDDILARKLARQCIRLPNVLCASWIIASTINELENTNRDKVAKWQESPWIKGELFLILNDDFSESLSGYCLKYDKFYGLLYEKEAQQDD
jgi:CRISPR-associated endonuclease/helicase Cas3